MPFLRSTDDSQRDAAVRKNKVKIVLFSALAALLAEGLCALFLRDIGGQGPGGPFGWIGVILLFPALVLAQLTPYFHSGVFYVVGFFEFFLPCWFITRHMYERR
jgi:hypothetical protein